jgi:signal transduction histidine kinase
MDHAGVLEIDIGEHLREDAESLNMKEKGQAVTLFIRDTGKGISEEYIDRIFDPFFTTRRKGTGLGLAIVDNIVRSHRGIIEVESRRGEGTCFMVTLPFHQEAQHGYEAHPRSG